MGNRIRKDMKIEIQLYRRSRKRNNTHLVVFVDPIPSEDHQLPDIRLNHLNPAPPPSGCP